MGVQVVCGAIAGLLCELAARLEVPTIAHPMTVQSRSSLGLTATTCPGQSAGSLEVPLP